MKASSQADGWKGKLIQHGEKGVLGIIGLLVLWMMYSGIKKEGLKPEKSPAELLKRVTIGEDHIAQAPKIKTGDKFDHKPYDEWIKTGLEKLKVEPYPSNFEPDEFPKIAKRSQPTVFPAEEVHATSLVVQVAINDPQRVQAQQAIIANQNTAKLRAEAIAAAKKAAKEQAEKARKDRAAANVRNPGGGRPVGEGRRPPENPLELPVFPQDEPIAPVVEQRLPHPAIQNLTGVTSETYPIAVVTALIPYRKQIENFNETMVKDRDIIPGRKPEEDSPIIATFTVQRARVVNPNDPEDKLVWEDNTKQAQDFFATNFKYLTKSDDPVVLSLHGPATPGLPKQNIPSWFTVSPLPTLADRKWQREVTHPRIPLITDLTEEEIKVEEANVFMPAAPAPGGGFGPQVPVEPVAPTEVELPEYVLLRHIDFKVAPGVNYRYRVTLTYKNPNVGLDSKYLDTDVTMTETLTTTPSRASNSVILPPLYQTLAGGDLTYPPAKRFEGLPTSRVWQWVIDLDRDRPTKRGSGEVAKDFAPVAVGDMLDLVGTVKNNLNRPAAQGEELVDYNFKAQREKVTAGRGIPYLVDVFGKETPPPPRPPRTPPVRPGETPIAPPVTTPEPPREQPYTEILFVDQDGKLRSSVSTYAETLIDNYKLRYEAAPAGAAPGGAMPGLEHGRENPLFMPRGAAAPGRNPTR